MTPARAARRILDALAREGLLLDVDARLPSAVTIAAGEPVAGSWWSHPKAHLVYHARGIAFRSDDVLDARLVNGKSTLVHRRLGPALVAVAESGEPWQTHGLSAAARRLLAVVRRRDVRSDRLPPSLAIAPKAVGDLVRDLERRLLLRGDEFHTETGAHAKVLSTWGRWARRARIARRRASVPEAKAAFETIARSWEGRFGVVSRLPWEPPGRRARRSSSSPE